MIYSRNKFDIGIRAGLSVDKYISYERKSYGEVYKNYIERGDYNFSGVISVTFTYIINNKISLMAEPQFNRTLIDNHDSQASNPHLYGVGINFGVLFNI